MLILFLSLFKTNLKLKHNKGKELTFLSLDAIERKRHSHQHNYLMKHKDAQFSEVVNTMNVGFV